jgi:hypothetical protein
VCNASQAHLARLSSFNFDAEEHLTVKQSFSKSPKQVWSRRNINLPLSLTTSDTKTPSRAPTLPALTHGATASAATIITITRLPFTRLYFLFDLLLFFHSHSHVVRGIRFIAKFDLVAIPPFAAPR